MSNKDHPTLYTDEQPFIRRMLTDDRKGADIDHAGAEAPRLLDLDEAVELLRGAYARRTLQNLAWAGKIRRIGRGERMRFMADWLMTDLLALARADTAQDAQPRAVSEPAKPVEHAAQVRHGKSREARSSGSTSRKRHRRFFAKSAG